MPGDAAAGVPVWDRFVRAFHWTLLTSFVVAFASHEDGYGSVHLVSGYVVALLVVARLIWGIVGSHHARFADFVRGPRAVMAYVGELLRSRAKRFLGHNPAGGTMIVVMLALLIVISVTGFLLTTTRFYGDEMMFVIHERVVHVMLICILLHVLGVLWSSRAHRENLVKAMITGRKRPLDQPGR